MTPDSFGDPVIFAIGQHLVIDPTSPSGLRRLVSGHGKRSKVGDMAGSLDKHDGYWRVKVGIDKYLNHRVVWLLAYGEWPNAQVDHINGNRSDNRLENLRGATNAENLQNLRRARRDNLSSGVLGVYSHNQSGKWQAKIKIPGGKRQSSLGLFDTVEAASAAYQAAKMKYHPFSPIATKSREEQRVSA